MDLVAIFTNYVLRRTNPEIADEFIDFLNHDIISYKDLQISEYVNFLNECYKQIV